MGTKATRSEHGTASIWYNETAFKKNESGRSCPTLDRRHEGYPSCTYSRCQQTGCEVDLCRSRPNASHPSSSQLRSVARTRNEGRGAASELLKPYDARLMRSYPISTRINHVANDDEECSAPVVEVAQIQDRPFPKARLPTVKGTAA